MEGAKKTKPAHGGLVNVEHTMPIVRETFAQNGNLARPCFICVMLLSGFITCIITTTAFHQGWGLKRLQLLH